MTTVTSARRRTPAERQLTAAAIATAVCVVASTLWICYVLVRLGDPGVHQPRDELGNLIYALPTAGAGMILHAHRPGNPLGWVLLVYALTEILPDAAAAPVSVEVTDPGIVGAVAAFAALCNSVNVTIFYVLPLWLPDGRLTTRRWWWYIGAVALFVVPEMAQRLDRPRQFGRPNPMAGNPPAHFFATATDALGGHDLLVSECLVGIVSAVLLARLLRPRRAGDGREVLRHRLRVAAMLGAYLFWAGMQDLYSRNFTEHYWLSYSLFAAAGLVWAVAVAYLVVRDHGWRLDRAARSVLIGLLLGTGVTGLFLVAAALLSGWLLPGRGGAALLLIALVYALGAALPRAARRVVALVDRLYYGERAQPYQVLRTLAGRVRQVVDPARLPETLCATVAEELRLPGVTLAVTTRAGRRTLATAGRLDGHSQDFALVHNGLPIGELTVGLRAGETRLEATDIDILRSLADQASPAVASLRLQEDLQASREQIVAAREEERRWLRRDIHDGLGPALAGLRLRVDNAATSADDGLADTLSGVSDGLGMTIKEVRRITDRLGPAPLGEFGLTRAVRQLTDAFSGAGLTVTAELSPDPLPELPAAVEVAAYRIAAEALNNVLRHARARTARVALRVDEEALMLTVQDDGVGYREDIGEQPGGGVGLRSMADRAAEIGGHCTVRALPTNGGTQVLAILPRSATADR
ncbi:histidine kinase/DNA gyrase B/HSP90-like ATPase [Streptomyces sp. 1114.5]|uniref:sensor histidine kinase n=1 Tax=Streptomyces sp. 1114.5 TaxID=1938830 RepID=UPI000EB15D1B|nr:ATP-binding protein [Streptomyces sp. 1114.5]RKT11596.1 histidine kinase/DNA gyrase B/HSP90-like ATPase [Streptomyces sp. 1114.5]